MRIHSTSILAALILVGGPSSALGQEAPTPQPPSTRVATSSASDNGSLWSEGPDSEYMFFDRKARQVGDLITVRIVETSQATRSAKTALDRESAHSAGVSALFGLETSITEAKPNVKPSALLGTSTSNSFSGDGSTARSGTLTATITARIVRVLPNRQLVLMGQQEVKVNNEVQILSVSGIVRPEDIAVNNEVLSTHIADARIEYTGQGAIATKNKSPWLSDVVDRVWPF